jgi:uncharacterized membrane protein
VDHHHQTLLVKVLIVLEVVASLGATSLAQTDHGLLVTMAHRVVLVLSLAQVMSVLVLVVTMGYVFAMIVVMVKMVIGTSIGVAYSRLK